MIDNKLQKIIEILKEDITNKDMPLMVGKLNKPQGIIGFKKAEIGHPVFEFQGKYIIYLESNYKVKEEYITVAVPYFKESLKPVIDFNTYGEN
jgi:hypothetical protein